MCSYIFYFSLFFSFWVWILLYFGLYSNSIISVKKRYKTVWIIKDIIPICKELQIIKSGQLGYVISYSPFTNENVEKDTIAKCYTFEPLETDLAAFDQLLQEIMELTKLAESSDSSKSHAWLKYYFEKRRKDDISHKQYLQEDAKSLAVAPNSIITNINRMGSQYSIAKLEGVKEKWIASQMKEREREFTEIKHITMFLGTWNVNGKKPGESLEAWLTKDLNGVYPDIYAIGFQELDLSAENLLLRTTQYEGIWAEHISRTLLTIPNHKYHMLAAKRLVGILLFIYVKTSLISYIGDVQTGSAATGIMGMMGNKGGVAIRFTVYDSTICIVNSHLNAHLKGVERRNQDYRDIVSGILFPNAEENTVSSIFEHDHLFWIGDLNYRLMLSDVEIKQKIKEQDWKMLMEFDQLTIQRRTGGAFEPFEESPLHFVPTYKYDVGTNNFDTSEKQRPPAWCDRVLWKGNNIHQTFYRRHELLTSDHKPVSGMFDVQCKQIITENRTRVYHSIVRQIDKMENESRPSATIDQNTLEFSGLKYLYPMTRSVTIENTGKVLAKFQFIPKLDEERVCKPWMWINPPFGLVVPGEKVKVNFTVHIDNHTVNDFNLGREKVEDILILHFDGGIDYFITITGSYLPSCFGSILTYLVRFPGPIRDTKPLPPHSSECLSIPKELWRIVDYIFRRGMETENLFLESGNQKEMELIRECLDTGKSFEEYQFNIYSMGETLVRFLESMDDSVIPCIAYQKVLECVTYEQCKELIASLPAVHYNTFYYLVSFLRELLNHAGNELTLEKLALVFSSVLIKRKKNKDTSQTEKESEFGIQRKAEFLEHFLRSTNELQVY